MNNNPELNEEWYINTLVMPDSIIMRVDSGSPAHLKKQKWNQSALEKDTFKVKIHEKPKGVLCCVN